MPIPLSVVQEQINYTGMLREETLPIKSVKIQSLTLDPEIRSGQDLGLRDCLFQMRMREFRVLK